jgi:hypothetical protein
VGSSRAIRRLAEATRKLREANSLTPIPAIFSVGLLTSQIKTELSIKETIIDNLKKHFQEIK